MTTDSAPSNLPAVHTMDTLPAEVTAGDWGAIAAIETTDLIVPKIFHQQANSEFVQDGTARPGDFCNSITKEKLAGKDEILEIIIWGLYKTVQVSKMDNATRKFKYDHTIQMTPQNAAELASKVFETHMIDGVEHKYNLVYHFQCVLPKYLSGLPFVLSLGSTKAKAGKKLSTIIYEMSRLKKPSAAFVFGVKSKKEENEQGSWFGVEVSQVRPSTAEELFQAHAWYLASKKQIIVADESKDTPAKADNSVYINPDGSVKVVVDGDDIPF